MQLCQRGPKIKMGSFLLPPAVYRDQTTICFGTTAAMESRPEIEKTQPRDCVSRAPTPQPHLIAIIAQA